MDPVLILPLLAVTRHNKSSKNYIRIMTEGIVRLDRFTDRRMEFIYLSFSFLNSIAYSNAFNIFSFIVILLF